VEMPSSHRIGENQSRLGFAFSPLGLVDLLAIAPFYFQLLLPETATSLLILRVFRGLRLLRVLKLSRYSPALNVLFSVLRKEARVLGVAMFILAVMLVVVSWGIYVLERDAQPAAFGTIPDAMWWSVVTLTTVGFGDVVPVTNLGKLFAGFAALLGIGMVALPSAILVAGFTHEIRRRSQTYHRALELAYSDGTFSAHEATELKGLREELGITTEDALYAEMRVRRAIAGLDACPHCGKPLGTRDLKNEENEENE
jgi:voltage-gated potassium channel